MERLFGEAVLGRVVPPSPPHVASCDVRKRRMGPWVQEGPGSIRPMKICAGQSFMGMVATPLPPQNQNPWLEEWLCQTRHDGTSKTFRGYLLSGTRS